MGFTYFTQTYVIKSVLSKTTVPGL
jgi:hypothetical protein